MSSRTLYRSRFGCAVKRSDWPGTDLTSRVSATVAGRSLLGLSRHRLAPGSDVSSEELRAA